jgi:hypothetical protein
VALGCPGPRLGEREEGSCVAELDAIVDEPECPQAAGQAELSASNCNGAAGEHEPCDEQAGAGRLASPAGGLEDAHRLTAAAHGRRPRLACRKTRA